MGDLHAEVFVEYDGRACRHVAYFRCKRPDPRIVDQRGEQALVDVFHAAAKLRIAVDDQANDRSLRLSQRRALGDVEDGHR